MTQQAVRLGPATAVFYENLSNYTVALQCFDETRQIIRETQARKLDHLESPMTLYALRRSSWQGALWTPPHEQMTKKAASLISRMLLWKKPPMATLGKPDSQRENH